MHVLSESIINIVLSLQDHMDTNFMEFNTNTTYQQNVASLTDFSNHCHNNNIVSKKIEFLLNYPFGV